MKKSKGTDKHASGGGAEDKSTEGASPKAPSSSKKDETRSSNASVQPIEGSEDGRGVSNAKKSGIFSSWRSKKNIKSLVDVGSKATSQPQKKSVSEGSTPDAAAKQTREGEKRKVLGIFRSKGGHDASHASQGEDASLLRKATVGRQSSEFTSLLTKPLADTTHADITCVLEHLVAQMDGELECVKSGFLATEMYSKVGLCVGRVSTDYRRAKLEEASASAKQPNSCDAGQQLLREPSSGGRHCAGGVSEEVLRKRTHEDGCGYRFVTKLSAAVRTAEEAEQKRVNELKKTEASASAEKQESDIVNADAKKPEEKEDLHSKWLANQGTGWSSLPPPVPKASISMNVGLSMKRSPSLLFPQAVADTVSTGSAPSSPTPSLNFYTRAIEEILYYIGSTNASAFFEEEEDDDDMNDCGTNGDFGLRGVGSAIFSALGGPRVSAGSGKKNRTPFQKAFAPEQVVLVADAERPYLEKNLKIGLRNIAAASLTNIESYLDPRESILAPSVGVDSGSRSGVADYFVSMSSRAERIKNSSGKDSNSTAALVHSMSFVSSLVSSIVSPPTLYAALLLAHRVRECKARYSATGGYNLSFSESPAATNNVQKARSSVESLRKQVAQGSEIVPSKLSEAIENICKAMSSLDVSLNTLDRFTDLACLLYEVRTSSISAQLRNEFPSAFLVEHDSAAASFSASTGAVCATSSMLMKLLFLLAGGSASIAADDRRSTGQLASDCYGECAVGSGAGALESDIKEKHVTDDVLLSMLLRISTADRVLVIPRLLGFNEAGHLRSSEEVRVCDAVVRRLFQFIGFLPYGDRCPQSIQEWLPLFPLYAMSHDGKRTLMYLYSASVVPTKRETETSNKNRQGEQQRQQRISIRPVSRIHQLRDVSRYVGEQAWYAAACDELENSGMLRTESSEKERTPSKARKPSTTRSGESVAACSASFKLQPVFVNTQAGVEHGEGQGPTKELFDTCSEQCTSKTLPAIDLTHLAGFALIPNGFRGIQEEKVKQNSSGARIGPTQNAIGVFTWRRCADMRKIVTSQSPNDTLSSYSAALVGQGYEILRLLFRDVDEGESGGFPGTRRVKGFRPGDVLTVTFARRDENGGAVGGMAGAADLNTAAALSLKNVVQGSALTAAAKASPLLTDKETKDREGTLVLDLRVERVVETTDDNDVILIFSNPLHSPPLITDYFVTSIQLCECTTPPFIHETGERYAWSNPQFLCVQGNQAEGMRVSPTPFTIGWLIGNAIPNGLLYFPSPIAPLFFRLLSLPMCNRKVAPLWLKLQRCPRTLEAWMSVMASNAGSRLQLCDLSLLSNDLVSRILKLAMLEPDELIEMLKDSSVTPMQLGKATNSKNSTLKTDASKDSKGNSYTVGDFVAFVEDVMIRDIVFNIAEASPDVETNKAAFWGGLLRGLQATPLGSQVLVASRKNSSTTPTPTKTEANPISPSTRPKCANSPPLFKQCSARVLRDVICGRACTDDDVTADFSFSCQFRLIFEEEHVSDGFSLQSAAPPHLAVFRQLLVDVMEGRNTPLERLKDGRGKLEGEGKYTGAQRGGGTSAVPLTAPEKRALLQFITGRTLLPGKERAEHIRIEMPLQPLTSRECVQYLRYLPSSHSCDNTLELPNYLECLLFAPDSPWRAAQEKRSGAAVISDSDRASAWDSLTAKQQFDLVELCRATLTAKLRTACTQSSTYELDEVVRAREQNMRADLSDRSVSLSQLSTRPEARKSLTSRTLESAPVALPPDSKQAPLPPVATAPTAPAVVGPSSESKPSVKVTTTRTSSAKEPADRTPVEKTSLPGATDAPPKDECDGAETQETSDGAAPVPGHLMEAPPPPPSQLMKSNGVATPTSSNRNNNNNHTASDKTKVVHEEKKESAPEFIPVDDLLKELYPAQ